MRYPPVIILKSKKWKGFCFRFSRVNCSNNFIHYWLFSLLLFWGPRPKTARSRSDWSGEQRPRTSKKWHNTQAQQGGRGPSEAVVGSGLGCRKESGLFYTCAGAFWAHTDLNGNPHERLTPHRGCTATWHARPGGGGHKRGNVNFSVFLSPLTLARVYHLSHKCFPVSWIRTQIAWG